MTRAVIYSRVSSEEQLKGYSIDDQINAGKALVAQRGWQLTKTYADEGESAKTFNRTQWRKLQSDARMRKFDVVVFDRIDRISRATVLDALMTIDAMRKYGVSMVSVSEPLDFTHPAGEIMLLMLLWFARQFLINLSRVVTRGRKSRAESGKSNANRPPFGYRRVYEYGRDGKVISSHDEPDPDTRAIACEMFARAEQPTETAKSITAWLRTTGHTMPSGKQFSRAAVQAMLRNKFYAGAIRYQGLREALDDRKRRATKEIQWFKGTHEALITEDQFARVQQANQRRRTTSVGTVRADKRSIYTLRGLLICSRCGARLTASTNRHGRARYRCPTTTEGKDCQVESRMIREAVLLPEAERLITSVAIHAAVFSTAANMLDSETTPPRALRVAEIDAELVRLDHMYRRGRIATLDYDAAVDALVKERETESAIEPLAPAAAVVQMTTLAEAWHKLPEPEARRSVLAALVEYAEVDVIEQRIVRWQMLPDYAQLIEKQITP